MNEERRNVFHLAIPCADLCKSAEFYSKLGCRIARRYEDRITMEFFCHQVVCHLCPDRIDHEPDIYPRHFGITFIEEQNFEAILSIVAQHRLEYFRTPFVRFKGLREEHRVFLLKDPSNNIIEFKYYPDPTMVY